MNTEVIVSLEEYVERCSTQLKKLASDIFKNPELGFEEKFACREQVNLLKEYGFKTSSPFGGLDTAYKAVRGSGTPVFCFVAEYDALPEIGHACGHNLICAAAIGAGKALADKLENDKIQGTVIVMGTPAEESKGGKLAMLEHDVLDGIDAVMMAHPSYRTVIDLGSTAIRRFDISYKGKAAHAATAPENGLNALDAAMLLFHGVGNWRQQLPESSRVHGVITDGGVVPNIIPAKANCRFFLRSPNDDILDKMEEHFHNMIKGAALMTGTEFEIRPYSCPYKSRIPNVALNQAYFSAAEHFKLNPVATNTPGRGSSDFGDFSHICPGVHVYFGISDHGIIAMHSEDFLLAAGGEYARTQMTKAAASMALVGYRFFTDEKFQKEVFQK